MFLDLYFMIWPQGCIASCHYLWISKSIKVVSILNLKVMQRGNLTYNFLVPLTLTKIDSKFCSLTYTHLKLSIMNSFPFIFSEQLFVHSKTEMKVQRFPIYLLSPQIHSLSPHQPPEQYIAYNRRTYMHTSQSCSLHSLYHGSLLVLYILRASTNI